LSASLGAGHQAGVPFPATALEIREIYTFSTRSGEADHDAAALHVSSSARSRSGPDHPGKEDRLPPRGGRRKLVGILTETDIIDSFIERWRQRTGYRIESRWRKQAGDALRSAETPEDFDANIVSVASPHDDPDGSVHPADRTGTTRGAEGAIRKRVHLLRRLTRRKERRSPWHHRIDTGVTGKQDIEEVYRETRSRESAGQHSPAPGRRGREARRHRRRRVKVRLMARCALPCHHDVEGRHRGGSQERIPAVERVESVYPLTYSEGGSWRTKSRRVHRLRRMRTGSALPVHAEGTPSTRSTRASARIARRARGVSNRGVRPA